jgi:hypothetical protein
LAEALKDAQVVVDVSNAPSWDDEAVMDFFQTSGRNLLAAEAVAGVKHHVALSVVGTERLLESGYFRAKLVSYQPHPTPFLFSAATSSAPTRLLPRIHPTHHCPFCRKTSLRKIFRAPRAFAAMFLPRH